MASVLRLPNKGHLIVCTDLQGCLADYNRIVEIFLESNAQADDTHLLFTGDLIHGPYIEPHQWPDFLGQFYRDASDRVVSSYQELATQFPNQVHALLGNHEHGHIGGPHTAKFANDEVALLETRIGRQKSSQMKALFATFPIAAIAPCGVFFSHGAPAANIQSIREIEDIDLDEAAGETPTDVLITPVLGPLLWARSAPDYAAQRFLKAVGANIAVYGHEVVPSGYQQIGHQQLIVSTSFGLPNSNKVYLRLDLSGDYQTVHDLREGCEILPLYPDQAAPEAPTLPFPLGSGPSHGG